MSRMHQGCQVVQVETPFAENYQSLEESHGFGKMRTLLALALFVLSLSALYGFAQSVTSGDLTGTVTDTSGEVSPKLR